jgi:gliding motility-associated-like protein
MVIQDKLILLLLTFPVFIYNSQAQGCLGCASNDSINLGVVLCLPLNGNPHDETVAKFQGTAMNNPQLISDRFGKANSAYSFNGTNQYIRLGDILDSVFCRTPVAKFTITGWARTNSVNTLFGAGLIFAKQAGGSGPDQWSISHFSDGTVRGIVKTSSLWDYVEWKTTTAIPTNQWFFFALMFDGSVSNESNRVTFYVNGLPTVFSRKNGTFGTNCVNSTQEITIGAGHVAGNPMAPANQYDGAVDDIRIYNRVISLNEIQALYSGKDSINYTKSSDTQICLGDSATLSVAGGDKFLWKTAGGWKDSLNRNVRVKPTAKTTYLLKISEGLCSVDDSILVDIKNTPANAGADKSICPGDSVMIGTTGPWSASWRPINGLSNYQALTPFAKPNNSIDYILTATEKGCITYDTVTVNLVNSLVTNAGSDKTICGADSITLSASGGTQFEWQPGNLFANNKLQTAKVFVPTTTTFFLKASSAACVAFDTITITVNNIKAAFDASPLNGLKPLPVKFQNKSISSSPIYFWEFGDGIGKSSIENPEYVFKQSGKFKVRLIINDNNGCADTAFAYIEVSGTSEVFIPNVFTPNGDSENEYFAPVYDREFYKQMTCRIWNRWGGLVHEFDDKSTVGWNGKSDGNDCSAGVYVYIMEFVDLNDQTQRHSGTLTLIR